jgi:hypothetical protein
VPVLQGACLVGRQQRDGQEDADQPGRDVTLQHLSAGRLVEEAPVIVVKLAEATPEQLAALARCSVWIIGPELHLMIRTAEDAAARFDEAMNAVGRLLADDNPAKPVERVIMEQGLPSAKVALRVSRWVPEGTVIGETR